MMWIHHLSWLGVFTLMLVAIAAGFVDTIAGGGGLITLPAMLIAGLPVTTAMGTNRMQGCIGELTAAIRFMRAGELNLRKLVLGFFCAAVGASVGTIVIQLIHPGNLKKIIAVLMLVILCYTVFSKQFVKASSEPRLSSRAYCLTIGTAIGFYNGFFGPGTGSFWVVSLIFFLGMNLKSAIIHAKPLNIVGNVVSLFWFGLGGHVAYLVALLMGVGQIIGASIGAHFVMSKESRFIRPIFILVVLAMTINIFIDAFL